MGMVLGKMGHYGGAEPVVQSHASESRTTAASHFDDPAAIRDDADLTGDWSPDLFHDAKSEPSTLPAKTAERPIRNLFDNLSAVDKSDFKTLLDPVASRNQGVLRNAYGQAKRVGAVLYDAAVYGRESLGHYARWQVANHGASLTSTPKRRGLFGLEIGRPSFLMQLRPVMHANWRKGYVELNLHTTVKGKGYAAAQFQLPIRWKMGWNRPAAMVGDTAHPLKINYSRDNGLRIDVGEGWQHAGISRQNRQIDIKVAQQHVASIKSSTQKSATKIKPLMPDRYDRTQRSKIKFNMSDAAHLKSGDVLFQDNAKQPKDSGLVARIKRNVSRVVHPNQYHGKALGKLGETSVVVQNGYSHWSPNGFAGTNMPIPADHVIVARITPNGERLESVSHAELMKKNWVVARPQEAKVSNTISDRIQARLMDRRVDAKSSSERVRHVQNTRLFMGGGSASKIKAQSQAAKDHLYVPDAGASRKLTSSEYVGAMTGIDYSVALSRMTSSELANQFHQSGQFQMGVLQPVQRSA